MFELAPVAKLARAGLKPHVLEPDVAVDIAEWRLLIQCKRPMTIAGIQKLWPFAKTSPYRARKVVSTPFVRLVVLT
jgi:hypothetical protein